MFCCGPGEVVVPHEGRAGPSLRGQLLGAGHRRASPPGPPLSSRVGAPLARLGAPGSLAAGSGLGGGHHASVDDILRRLTPRLLTEGPRHLGPQAPGPAAAGPHVPGKPRARLHLHGAPTPGCIRRLLHPAAPGGGFPLQALAHAGRGARERRDMPRLRQGGHTGDDAPPAPLEPPRRHGTGPGGSAGRAATAQAAPGSPPRDEGAPHPAPTGVGRPGSAPAVGPSGSGHSACRGWRHLRGRRL
jgi:hypothetical protein